MALGGASLIKKIAAGNPLGAAVDAVGVVIDIAAVFAPGLPGGAGSLIKARRAAIAAGDALEARKLTLAINRISGEIFEKKVLKILDLSKNKGGRVTLKSGKFRVPDSLEQGVVAELKAGNISSRSTHQVMDLISGAAKGEKVILVVAKDVNIPKKLKKLQEAGRLSIIRFDVIRPVL